MSDKSILVPESRLVKLTRPSGLFGSALLTIPAGTILRLGEQFRVTPESAPAETLYYVADGPYWNILIDIADPDIEGLTPDGVGSAPVTSQRR